MFNVLTYMLLLLFYQVRLCDFIKNFFQKTQEYVQHVHVARWQDDGTMSILEYVEILSLLGPSYH